MSYLALAALPETDPLRNQPLLAVGAEYRDAGKKEWRKVERNYAIASSAYNALGYAWTATADWRVPEQK